MVKVRITDIPSHGLQIKDELSLTELNNRMNEAEDNDVKFTESPKFAITIKPEVAGAELTGNITAKYIQPCGICLEEVTHEVSEPLSLTLKAKTKRPGIDRPTSSDEWEDGVGIIYFDGEHIDLEEILQETIILKVNPYDSQHKGCPGLAEEATDKDNEKKTTLGDLIKNARVN